MTQTARLSLADQENRFAAKLSLTIGVLLLVTKFWAYYLTNSEAIFSDAIESIANVVAALFALLVLLYASRPADHSHPYGHGKIEFFSVGFEGGLVALAGLTILAKGAYSLIFGYQLRNLNMGILLIAAAGVVNLALGLYLLKAGRNSKSETLVASAHHVISDFWTSAGITIGLFVVKISGFSILDPLMAFAVGAYLSWTGFKIVRASLAGLLDESDNTNLSKLVDAFERNRFPGIIQGHHTRVVRSGRYHHIDMHVVVPEFWNVKFAHDQTESFERSVIRDYSHEGEIHFHIDPCRQRYCQSCDLDDCPIRLEEFKAREALTLVELQSPKEPAAGVSRQVPRK